MDPFMPDWVIDLRNNGYGGPYGTEFVGWLEEQDVAPHSYAADKIAWEVCGVVIDELLGVADAWKALPKDFREALEEELDRHQEAFEAWLMETYPQGVPCR